MQHLRFVISLAAAAAIISGCEKKQAVVVQRPADEAVAVTVASTQLLPVQRNVEIVGTLFGEEDATLSAKVPGRVVRVLKDIGDRADVAEPLAEIDPTDYQLARQQARMNMLQALSQLGLTQLPGDTFDPATVPTVQQSRLQADNAEARFRRAEKLFKQTPPLISEQDYADLKTTSDVARSACDVAMLNARALLAQARTRQSELELQDRKLADATVRTPAPDGLGQAKGRYGITAKLVSVGEYVREGTPMFRVIADDPIRFRATVPEQFLPDIKLGQKVRVEMAAYKSQFLGVVQRINPQVDQTSRSFQVEIQIPNADSRLRPGAFARGWVDTKQDADVTFVPAESIIAFAGLKKVFTVKGGKAAEHQVVTGIRRGNLVEITDGLSGKLEVVTTGASRLANGSAIDVRAAAPTTAPQARN